MAVFNYEHVAEMINHICQICKKEYGVVLAKEGRKTIISRVLEHYSEHSKNCGVQVTGADPYKILSWVGIEIYLEALSIDKEMAIKFLASTIAALSRVLKSEGRCIPDWYLRKIALMVVSEFSKKPHLGLGKNGLYLAFKGAAIVSCEPCHDN